jgi:excisionase family DNA binding protein
VAGCRLLIESPTPLDALNRPLLPPTAPRTDISVAPVWTEPPEPRPAPVLLTIAEVAAALRMSEKSIRRRIKSGIIRTAPTGGRLVRISSDELRRLAAGDPCQAP